MGKRRQFDNSPLVLSLCMIVRDNEATIEPCLSSIKPWVDEMVVVDTGSKDQTPAIAQQLGARLFHFPWCDDFSAARNESLRHARGRWLFWMDSDDTIDAENGQKLRALAVGKHASTTLGYVMQVHCPGGDDRARQLTVVDHVKLVRNHPQLRFEFRIHEQLLPSIRRLGGEVGWTDIFVVHSGADQSDAGRQRKYERDLRILHRELQDKPNHPFVLFNLGMTYDDMGDYETAVRYLRLCLDHSDASESHVRKAYALLIHSLDGLKKTDEAVAVCRVARQRFPNDVELFFRQGAIQLQQGDLSAAVDSFRGALASTDERHFSSIDPAISGYKARFNLALCYEQTGQLDDAERQWRLIIQEHPKYRPAWQGLGRVLLHQRRTASAEVVADQLKADEELAPESYLLAARMAENNQKTQQAIEVLEEAVRMFPNDVALLEEHSRLQFTCGEPAKAAASLASLVQNAPTNAAAMHNLGALYVQQGDFETAIDWYRRSLLIRPDATQTQSEYMMALESAGRPDEAQQFRDNGLVHEELSSASPTIHRNLAGSDAKAPRSKRKLHVAVVTVGYNLPGATENMVDSALDECRHDVAFCIFLHSRFSAKVDELERLARRDKVEYRDYGQNRGLAKSWNEGILWGFEQQHDVVIVVNEDVVFEPGDLARLATAAHEQRDRFLVMANCFHRSENQWGSSEYGCFAYNTVALQTLGAFDENFFPIFYEDSDFRRRAFLADLEPGFCPQTRIRHEGSASLLQEEVARQNQMTYAANRAYFIQKWGGDGGQERFDRPFDDERFTLFIDPRVREHPYPGHDRTDQSIVKI